VPSDDSEEEISWNSSDDEDVDDQDKSRDDNEGEKNDECDAGKDDDDDQDDAEKDDDGDGDDGNGKEDQGLRQESSSVSSFVTSMVNLISDAGVESIFTTASSPIAPLQSSTPIMTPSTIATITTSSDAPIPQTTIPSAVLQNLPTFYSVFHFEDKVKSLEVNFLKFIQTNQFVEAVSNIPGIVHHYMTQKMTKAIRKAVQIQTDRLQDSFQRENDEFLRTIDENRPWG
nr:hypothetical protein [Tanacetum cinerariifolium]